MTFTTVREAVARELSMSTVANCSATSHRYLSSQYPSIVTKPGLSQKFALGLVRSCTNSTKLFNAMASTAHARKFS